MILLDEFQLIITASNLPHSTHQSPSWPSARLDIPSNV